MVDVWCSRNSCRNSCRSQRKTSFLAELLSRTRARGWHRDALSSALLFLLPSPRLLQPPSFHLPLLSRVPQRTLRPQRPPTRQGIVIHPAKERSRRRSLSLSLSSRLPA